MSDSEVTSTTLTCSYGSFDIQSCYVKNGILFVNFAIQLTSDISAWSTFMTMPSGFRPLSAQQIPATVRANGTWTSYRVQFNASGIVSSSVALSTGDWIAVQFATPCEQLN